MSLAPRTAAAPARVRTLIADDSVVVRGLVRRWLEAEADIEVVGAAHNGRAAVELAGAVKPAVIVLDVEMPELDGVAAIPALLAAAPGARILMSSTLTRRNAEITLKALSAGAADYLAKPEAGKLGAAEAFRVDLVAKVKALGASMAPRPRPAALARPPAAAFAPSAQARRGPVELIVIGASTGGPQALERVLPAIVGRVAAPILVVQHMPPLFTAILASHLAKLTDDRVAEAIDGERPQPGRAYIAPGDRHLTVERRGGALVSRLDTSPPVNFCRPAVDPLFASAARAAGAGTLAVVLTGMGVDGREGTQAIVSAGGAALAQDEATSVVWGMPGAVLQAGLAEARPLQDMAEAIVIHAQGRTR